MLTFVRHAVAGLALAAFSQPIIVAAQNPETKCNPTIGQVCPPDPAFGGDATFDFTTATSLSDLDSFWDVDDGIKYNSKLLKLDKNGASFFELEELNAPTIISKKYLFFGKVEIEMQAAPGAGIVTALTLLSDCNDEIDWEFVGANRDVAETNLYRKNSDDHTHGGKTQLGFDATGSTHTYTLEWTPSFISFSIDGKIRRTVTPAEASNGAAYPQTPMHIKLGTWIAGGKDDPPGRVEWGGGHVDWSKGPFKALFKRIKVTDYGGGHHGAKEYSFGDTSGDWKSIKVNGGTEFEMPTASGATVGKSDASQQPSSPTLSQSSTTTTSSSLVSSKASTTSTATGGSPVQTTPSSSSNGTSQGHSTSAPSAKPTSGAPKRMASCAILVITLLLSV